MRLTFSVQSDDGCLAFYRLPSVWRHHFLGFHERLLSLWNPRFLVGRRQVAACRRPFLFRLPSLTHGRVNGNLTFCRMAYVYLRRPYLPACLKALPSCFIHCFDVLSRLFIYPAFICLTISL